MLALKILAVIVLICFLIGLISVGADVSYEAEQLSVAAKVCGLSLKIFPKEPTEGKPKKEKKKKEKKKKEKPEETAEGEADGKKKKKLPLDINFEEIMALVEKVLHGIAKFRRISIDRLKIDLIYTGKDPYNAAVQFAYINALLSSVGPMFASKLQNADTFVRTDIDFAAEKIKIDAGLALSIRIWQIFSVLNTILFGAIGILIKNRIRVIKTRTAEKRELKREIKADKAETEQ